MNRKDMWERSKAAAIWIAQGLNGLNLLPGARTKYVGGLLDLSLDHHAAILVLCDEKTRLYGPALALLRCQCEAFFLGTWLARHAKDEQVNLFEQGRLSKKLEWLSSQLERADAEGVHTYPVGMFAAVRGQVEAMHGFTHGGVNHASRRSAGITIEPTYAESEITSLLHLAATMAYYAAAEVFLLSSAPELARECVSRANELVEMARQEKLISI